MKGIVGRYASFVETEGAIPSRWESLMWFQPIKKASKIRFHGLLCCTLTLFFWLAVKNQMHYFEFRFRLLQDEFKGMLEKSAHLK